MADKSNDTGSRIVHKTGQGFARNVPARFQHGTVEEITARVGGTFSTLPDNKPTTFKQLGPASSGGNANDLKPRARKGLQKFGNAHEYT